MEEVLTLADEHGATANAEHVEDLLREDVVAGPEEADEQGGDHRGGRDEAEGRELVPGADPERERQQRNEEERRDDLAEPAAPLAARVEPRLREHEHHHERHEGQPLALRLPEHAPEDRRVPVVDLPQRERGVERQREAADVQEDEEGDATDAEGRGAELRASDDERLRAPDVA